MNYYEDNEQAKFTTDMKREYPDIKFNADGGGVRYGSGLQAILRGKRLKRAGHSAGYPDIYIPYPIIKSNGEVYHGLYIEFKYGKNKVEPGSEQEEWINYLMDKGYCVCVCYSCEEAMAVVKEYLNR